MDVAFNELNDSQKNDIFETMKLHYGDNNYSIRTSMLLAILKNYKPAGEYCLDITKNYWQDIENNSPDIQFKAGIIQSIINIDEQCLIELFKIHSIFTNQIYYHIRK